MPVGLEKQQGLVTGSDTIAQEATFPNAGASE
jgi:hypothetical protein